MTDNQPLDSEAMIREARRRLEHVDAPDDLPIEPDDAVEPIVGHPRVAPAASEPIEEQPQSDTAAPEPRSKVPEVTACELRLTGTTIERLQGTRWEVLVGGSLIADITSEFLSTDFNDAADHRESIVRFTDGREWRIRPIEPGPRGDRTTLFGNTKEVLFNAKDRVVVVEENGTRLAETVGEIASQVLKRSSFEVRSDGRSYTLDPSQADKAGTIEGYGHLTRSGLPGRRVWTYTATTPTPLTVVLVHHHVLIRDWHTESSD